MARRDLPLPGFQRPIKKGTPDNVRNKAVLIPISEKKEDMREAVGKGEEDKWLTVDNSAIWERYSA